MNFLVIFGKYKCKDIDEIKSAISIAVISYFMIPTSFKFCS